jgi:hypothetical protein
MKATEIPVNLTLPPPIVPRSPGQHVSGIIRCLATEMGILKPEWAEEMSLTDVREITDPTAVLRICIGLAWEEWYIPQLQEVLDHPGEMLMDGVYLSHDGESLSSVMITPATEEWVVLVHEIKSTYKSTRTVGDLTAQFMWLAQIKAYCKAKATRYAMLHVLFLCGDYTYPIRPLIRKWLIEFTQQELDENWQLLLDYRDHRLAIEAAKREESLVAIDWDEVKNA